MGFQEMYALTQNDTLKAKVRMAGIKAATAVLNDPGRSDEHRYCNLVIKEPMSDYWLNQMMFSVVTNPVINQDSPDDDVEFQVNAVFQDLALAYNQTN